MTESIARAQLTNRVIGDPEMRRLLVVDDEETIRVALSKFLRARGYDVDTADSGTMALEMVKGTRYALMLCDIRLPGLTGLELVPQVRTVDPDMAVVMLTAVNDVLTAAESISLGAMEYLTKPVDLQDLVAAVQRVIHRRDLGVEQRNVERLIRDEVGRQTSVFAKEKQALLDASVDAMANLVALHEGNDPFRAGMSLRVAALSQAIAEELGLSEGEVHHVVIAARLHDVGKIALRDAVLNKPGALSPEEFEHVKEHVNIGVEILSPMRQLQEAIEYVRDHHEHWDGTGYPRGIDGERISIGGRILCAADAFIALTSRRAYRPAMSSEDTIDYLAAHANGFLDPTVYAALNVVVTQKRVLGLTAD
jgi:putative two-component system response regulator